MNNGKYLEGRFINERVLYYEYPQINNNGTNIIKRRVVRPLKENEKVVNGEVITIEDPLIDE